MRRPYITVSIIISSLTTSTFAQSNRMTAEDIQMLTSPLYQQQMQQMMLDYPMTEQIINNNPRLQQVLPKNYSPDMYQDGMKLMQSSMAYIACHQEKLGAQSAASIVNGKSSPASEAYMQEVDKQLVKLCKAGQETTAEAYYDKAMDRFHEHFKAPLALKEKTAMEVCMKAAGVEEGIQDIKEYNENTDDKNISICNHFE